MGKTETCLQMLETEKLFHDVAHKSRFKELMDVFSSQPFFSNGICKCMYLAAWDDEHFLVLLEMLSAMSFGTGATKDDMTRDGEERRESSTEEEQPLYALSLAFTSDTPYQLPDPDQTDEETMFIIKQALKAAEIIDDVLSGR